MRAAFLTVLLAVFSANAQVKDPWTQPHGLVPDKETAIKIAEAVLFPIYGEGRISGERPYKVTLTDGFLASHRFLTAYASERSHVWRYILHHDFTMGRPGDRDRTRGVMHRDTSNQSLQPTPSRLVSSLIMIKIPPEIASRTLASRG